MARTIPAGLITAINDPSQQPVLSVTIQDSINRFSLLATATNPGQSVIIKTSAGHFLRATCTQVSNPATIYISRITNPATASQWTTQTSIATTADMLAGCGLVQTGTTIRCFYQNTTTRHIVYRDSTNDGVTWGAEVDTAISNPLGLGNYCFGIAATDTSHVWAAYGSYTDNHVADGIYKTVLSGTWSAWVTDGPIDLQIGAIRGLTCVAPNNFAGGLVTKAYLKGLAAVTFLMGVNSSVVIPLDNPDLGLALTYPGLWFDGTTYYLTTQEVDDGTVSGVTGTRTSIWTSTDFVHWGAFQHLGQVFQYGANTITAGGQVYVCDGNKTYTAPIASAATDLSNDVLSITIHEKLNQPTQATIVLDNSAGQYNALTSITLDARVQISSGYGAYSVLTHTLLVDDYRYEANSQGYTLQLTMRDAGKLLDYEQGRFLAYRSQSLQFMVQEVARQAGLLLSSVPATTQFGYTIACFIISPGERWIQAFDRLAQLYGFAWYVDETQHLTIKEQASSDASTWTFGTEAIATASAISADQANIVRVIGVDSNGNSVSARGFDTTNILNVGRERYRHIVDRVLDTVAKCQTRATLALRNEQSLGYAARLYVALNQHLQVNDVITFTDTGVAVTSQKARISELVTIIDPQIGEWTHELVCTGI